VAIAVIHRAPLATDQVSTNALLVPLARHWPTATVVMQLVRSVQVPPPTNVSPVLLDRLSWQMAPALAALFLTTTNMQSAGSPTVGHAQLLAAYALEPRQLFRLASSARVDTISTK